MGNTPADRIKPNIGSNSNDGSLASLRVHALRRHSERLYFTAQNNHWNNYGPNAPRSGDRVLIWAHGLQLWHLYILAFAFGIADAFSGPAAQSYVPFLIEEQQLTSANSISQGTLQLTTIVGPAPAGIVVKLLGVVWAFFLDAFSFLFVIAALWKLPDSPYKCQTPTKVAFWKDLFKGIALVNHDGSLRLIFILAAILNFCMSGTISVGLPYLVKQTFDSPAAYGAAVSSLALGGLLGTLLGAFLRRYRRGPVLIGATALVGLCLGAVAIAHSLWILLVLLTTIGGAVSISNIYILSWCQGRIAPEIRGRVMSVLLFATSGLLPISLAISGAIVQHNLRLMFLVSGTAVLLVASFATLHRAVREIR